MVEFKLKNLTRGLRALGSESSALYIQEGVGVIYATTKSKDVWVRIPMAGSLNTVWPLAVRYDTVHGILTTMPPVDGDVAVSLEMDFLYLLYGVARHRVPAAHMTGAHDRLYPPKQVEGAVRASERFVYALLDCADFPEDAYCASLNGNLLSWYKDEFIAFVEKGGIDGVSFLVPAKKLGTVFDLFYSNVPNILLARSGRYVQVAAGNVLVWVKQGGILPKKNVGLVNDAKHVQDGITVNRSDLHDALDRCVAYGMKFGRGMVTMKAEDNSDLLHLNSDCGPLHAQTSLRFSSRHGEHPIDAACDAATLYWAVSSFFSGESLFIGLLDDGQHVVLREGDSIVVLKRQDVLPI